MTYTVGDLRKVIDGVPDHMPVVTIAHGFHNAIRLVEVRQEHSYLDPKVEGPVFRLSLVIES